MTVVEAPTLVKVSSMAKAFGPTQAIRDASFELRAGEVHALVGENGSGKSTLVKILSGVHAPDAGTLELFGRQVPTPATPKAAQQAGIVTVFQEILVADARSVVDNIWLGMDGLLRTRIPRREKRRRAGELLEALLERPVGLDALTEDLSLSDRQACCIVRALVREPRVLILDEATSALDVATRDRLFQLLTGLSAKGVGVVFITHRMDEISEIGDRITVMRSGETVAELQRDNWTPQELVRLMTGSERLVESSQRETGAERLGELAITVRGLQLEYGRAPFSAEIRAGELIGVAGLEGHGQEEFLLALVGGGVRVAGEVVRHLDSREVAVTSPSQASKIGIAYVPRDRRQSLFGWMSVRENFALPTLRLDTSKGWLRPRLSRRRLEKSVSQLSIVLGDADHNITTLSGGNQQKVVIGRWLASGPAVLLLNDPTRGIDIGAKRDLYTLLTTLADAGLAVVMISSEVDEQVELMDRVLVFREHELFREIARDELSRQNLVSAFFGETETAAPAWRVTSS